MMLSANQAPSSTYGQFGPAGGSMPAWIMRSGQFAPFAAMHARHDIEAQYVQDATAIPVGQPAPAAPAAIPAQVPMQGYFGAASVDILTLPASKLYAPSIIAGVAVGVLTGVLAGGSRLRNAGIGAVLGAALSATATRVFIARTPAAPLKSNPF